ncbi:MAG: NUDIX hydrolase [Actinomycetota bacterium]|nr:NUDIX hydrolase [Actinomycetota bacterium]
MTSNQSFFCGVQCVVYQQPGKASVLLGRRFQTSGHGLWALPGGHVEFNESPIITARRELLEETGLFGVTARLGPTFFTYTTETPYAHVPVVFEDVRGKAHAMRDEHFSELRFFPLDKLPRRLFEPSRRTLATLGGPLHTALLGQSHASFLKIDMAVVDAEPSGESCTILLFRDVKRTTLVATKGHRQRSGHDVKQSHFSDFDAAVRRLDGLVRRHLEDHYLVTDVSGDLTVDGVHEILPHAGKMRMISDVLIRRLVEDDQFRHAFADQFDRADPPPPSVPARQLVLFDV